MHPATAPATKFCDDDSAFLSAGGILFQLKSREAHEVCGNAVGASTSRSFVPRDVASGCRLPRSRAWSATCPEGERSAEMLKLGALCMHAYQTNSSKTVSLCDCANLGFCRRHARAAWERARCTEARRRHSHALFREGGLAALLAKATSRFARHALLLRCGSQDILTSIVATKRTLTDR